MSICCRSISFWSFATADGLSTVAPASSFCWAACSPLFLSFSSFIFCWLSACTLPASVFPAADSAAIRWMFTKAYFVPSGKGGCTASAGCAGCAGACACAKLGAASIPQTAAAPINTLITVAVLSPSHHDGPQGPPLPIVGPTFRSAPRTSNPPRTGRRSPSLAADGCRARLPAADSPRRSGGTAR